MKKKKIDPYAHLKLREQIYLECRAMAEYTLARGKGVPHELITVIESFEEDKKNGDIQPLMGVHSRLSRLILPATPKTVLLLDIEQEKGGLLKFLGPVTLVRKLMLAALFFVSVFIALTVSPYIRTVKGSIFEEESLVLFMNMLFYIASAGLGGAFSALYKANTYIVKGTFDPAYQSSYWIRFFLGLISGLIMAIVIAEESLSNEFLAPGVMRPLMALMGGFSADLLYTFLNRMVESVKSLFRGSVDGVIENKTRQLQGEMENKQREKQIEMAKKVMKLRKDVEKDPLEIDNQLSALVDEFMVE